mmetsp:Transcript_71015/g.200494  ORF Transcript_71015/g.200494 Transcript_71015/m.200494 type:complete len:280 (-) Transcript_71015:759-1598(-)
MYASGVLARDWPRWTRFDCATYPARRFLCAQRSPVAVQPLPTAPARPSRSSRAGSSQADQGSGHLDLRRTSAISADSFARGARASASGASQSCLADRWEAACSTAARALSWGPRTRLGFSLPAISASSVDFPAPFAPTIATRLCIVSCTFTPLRIGACPSPYRNIASCSVSTGSFRAAAVAPSFSGIGKHMRAPPAPSPPAAKAFVSRRLSARAWSPPRAPALKAAKLPGWYASWPSGVKWMTSVQTLSRKPGSWETIRAVPPVSAAPVHVLLMKLTSH